MTMGSEQVFQPLTREDTITVVLYRAGIVLSAIIITGLAYLLSAAPNSGTGDVGPYADLLAYGLYVSVGMSVFFIHLYIGKFKTFLKSLYYLGLVGLAALLFTGQGSLTSALVHAPSGALLLLPLSGCLGFVTAKEAFCFRLFEGYFLALIMPFYLVLVASRALSGRGLFFGLTLIALLLVVFTLRKAIMPLAYDIGDKSAYQ
jgi:uncharacterized integral membrane protein